MSRTNPCLVWVVACVAFASACFKSVPPTTTGGNSVTPTEPANATPGPQRDYMHSPELNRIMKGEVNKPFSQLTFYVFHGGDDFDFEEIAKVAAGFVVGIKKVRAFPNPPVQSEQGREVFATFLETLENDAVKLSNATARRDRGGMQTTLGKLSRTCNSCHHFFRLDINDSPEQ